jgi:hypothetical protein
MSREYNEDEVTICEGWLKEDEVTYVGCNTVTAPDGKEYPIKDRD